MPGRSCRLSLLLAIVVALSSSLCIATDHLPALLRIDTILQIQPVHPTVQLMQQAYAELGIQRQLELLPTARAVLEIN